jgi:hypothetical protein
MTVITNARPTANGWAVRARRTLATTARQGAKVVSAARHRYRRPALTISGLACVSAAAYQVDLGVGLLVTGLMCLVFEWVGGDE